MLVLWIVAIACAFGDWWFVWRDETPDDDHVDRRRWVTKPGVLVALIAIAAICDTGGLLGSSAKGWLLAALVLCLAGDVFLLAGARFFLAGLAAFLVGHIAYVVAFVGINSESSPWSALVLTAMPFAFGIIGGARGHGRVLAAAVVAYFVVISAMYVAAAGTREGLILTGAALFVASDAMLGWNRFVGRQRPLPVLVISTYHVAQACFVAWMALAA